MYFLHGFFIFDNFKNVIISFIKMRKLIAYPLTLVYLLTFSLILLIFHPIQWFCFNVFGYKAHKKSVDIFNFCLVKNLWFLGNHVSFKNNFRIPNNTPIIIVANHQSMSDIPALIWFMKKHHVKFVSKKELGKGIPSVSYNLRHGGSALIDRSNPRQSILAIRNFGKYIQDTKRAAVIFPEGTRSRDGIPKKFQTKGLEALMKFIPDALIVPISINNSWKTSRYGKFPMGIGLFIKFEVHQPLKASEYEKDVLLESIEKTIKDNIIK